MLSRLPWTEEGGSRTYIGEASPIVYAIAGGYNDKVCNPESVAVKKDALSLKVGKSAGIKATVKGVKHGRKALKKQSCFGITAPTAT